MVGGDGIGLECRGVKEYGSVNNERRGLKPDRYDHKKSSKEDSRVSGSRLSCSYSLHYFLQDHNHRAEGSSDSLNKYLVGQFSENT